MGSMGGSSTTTTTPSPFDQQKADTARLMSEFLMPRLQQGMAGQSSQLDQLSLTNLLNQQRRNIGRFGVESGAPQFQDYQRAMTEGLTKPNQDAMKMAMNMYQSSMPQGSPSSSTTTDPGLLNEAASVGQLALMASLFM